jgi:hypothetical protein
VWRCGGGAVGGGVSAALQEPATGRCSAVVVARGADGEGGGRTLGRQRAVCLPAGVGMKQTGMMGSSRCRKVGRKVEAGQPLCAWLPAAAWLAAWACA